MKRYEYKALYDRVTIAMGPKEFGDWVFKKLNEWGTQGWFIVNYQTPTATQGNRTSLTGELLATGSREILESEAAPDTMPASTTENVFPINGGPVIGG